MTLRVDDRYGGAHGIGRYAHEVLVRLRPEWTSLRLDGSPHDPFDAFRRLPADVASRDLIYSPGYAPFVRAARHIVTIHDLIQRRWPWPGRAKFLAYYDGPVRRTVRRAGIVLTVSQTSARAIREWVRDDDVRIVDAGNGLSPAFGPQGAAEASDEPYALFVGNTRPYKNLEVVLRALALVRDVRLRAVLPEREVAAAASRAAALGVAGRVELLHGVDDDRLARLYRGAVITTVPSTSEGFGLPALESIACGTPVLYWRGCEAVAEIVGDRAGSTESPHDAEEWAAALEEAAHRPRRVDPPPPGLYDWDRTASIISDVLEEALA